jgi:hypothetical protein
MRTLMAVLAASLLVSACGQNTASEDGSPAGAAADSPKVNAGLWELKNTIMGTEEVMRQCVTDPLDGSRPFLTTGPDNSCVGKREAIPGGFRQANQCDVLGAKTTVEVTFTGGADAFELSTATSTEGSNAVVTGLTGRRLGPCPGGMSDGDVVE